MKSHILFVYRVDHAVTAAETAVDYIRTDIVRNNAAGDIIEFGRRFENDIVFNVQIFERCGDNITEQPGVAVFGVDVEIGKSVSVSVKIPGEIQICVVCNRIERFAVEIDVGSQFDIRFLIFVRTAVNAVRECFELRSVRDFIRTFNRSHTFYHGIRSRKSFNGNRYRTLRHERIFAIGVGSENRVTRLYRRRTLVIRRYAQAERHGRSFFHVSRNASVEQKLRVTFVLPPDSYRFVGIVRIVRSALFFPFGYERYIFRYGRRENVIPVRAVLFPADEFKTLFRRNARFGDRFAFIDFDYAVAHTVAVRKSHFQLLPATRTSERGDAQYNGQ